MYVCIGGGAGHGDSQSVSPRPTRTPVPHPHPHHTTHPPQNTPNRPFFLWRGWPCVDGSILAGRKDVPSHLRGHEHVTFDYVEDEALRCVRVWSGLVWRRRSFIGQAGGRIDHSVAVCLVWSGLEEHGRPALPFLTRHRHWGCGIRVANKQDFMALSDPDGLKALVDMGYVAKRKKKRKGTVMMADMCCGLTPSSPLYSFRPSQPTH